MCARVDVGCVRYNYVEAGCMLIVFYIPLYFIVIQKYILWKMVGREGMEKSKVRSETHVIF